MNRPTETYKGEIFFHDNLHLYVNRATEDFAVPMHDHDFIEFAYIGEGSGFHHIGDKVHEVRKGQLLYIPIGTSHVFRPVSTDKSKHQLIVYNCVFSLQLLMKLREFTSDATIKQYFTSLHEGSEAYFFLTEQDDSIEKLIILLHREYALPRTGSTDNLHALLLQLLITVYRLKQQAQQPNPHVTRKLYQFEQLLNYVEQNLSNELTLEHLAQISRWSERHLQRLFKQHTEQSFNRYIQYRRIQKSCELLRSTSLKISTISEKVGYKDLGSFIAVFKRNIGTTPSGYRAAVDNPPLFSQ